ncbi:MAG: lysophospholipid acyltransferase family protein, partial [Acidiferrobacter sp.]
MTAAFKLAGAHRVRARLSFLAPKYWLTWVGLGLLRLSLYLPLRLRAWTGKRLGDLFYRANHKRRRIAAINIALCFPAWTPEQQEKAVRQHFRFAAQALFHIAVLWWGSEKTIDCCLRIKGLHHYEQARAAGRNIIVLHCHAVGLEASLALSRYFPYVGFMKPLKNPVLDFVMTRGRERFGGCVFD